MNYGQIRTQFKSVLNRSDCTDALADTFISQGLARSQRILRSPLNEKSVIVTTDETFVSFPVPSDLIAVINFSAGGKFVQFIPTGRFYEIDMTVNDIPQAGRPIYWTRVGSSILVKPLPPADLDLQLDYYGEFEQFVSDATETTLGIVAPDLIVYGGLSFAADYFIDDRRDSFESRWQSAMAELQDQATGVEGPAQIMPTTFYGEY